MMVMIKYDYIDEFEVIDDYRNGKIIINLNGRLDKCGFISLCFDIGLSELKKWTNNLFPSWQFGLLVLTAFGGNLDHKEAKRKHLSGKIFGYVFKEIEV